jgi:hypothetical protein
MFHPVPRTDRWDPLLVAAVLGLLALGLALVEVFGA